jgi:N-acetylglucosaminyldiphosphoundecaprenol N-acetyl-beta-D-mannosaminyltransferase
VKPSNYSLYLQTVRQRARRSGATVLSSFIDSVDWDQALARLATWARLRESRYVCLCNVHSVVTADQDPAFHEVIAGADMALPDGAPVAWSLQQSGFPEQQRINGPDLMWRYMRVAEELGQSVYFYGSSEDTLRQLRQAVARQFPTLRVAGMMSPPFRELSAEEDQAHVDAINRSGAHVVFVGLGCPKQEVWMAQHKGRVQGVMLGVGAAFDYHAGTLRRAPVWMQNHGLEWAYRLASEPRRLFKRYLVTNTTFVWKQGLKMLQGRF